jgi:hypothetical protein
MGKTFNPAERLYIILEKASRKESNITIKQVWTEVFAVDPTDSKGLFLCIADLIELVNEAKEQLKKYEDTNNRLYLESFTNIDKVLSITNLNSDWGAPKNILNDTTMLGLQHCSLALSRKQSEIRVEETKLLDKFLSEHRIEITPLDTISATIAAKSWIKYLKRKVKIKCPQCGYQLIHRAHFLSDFFIGGFASARCDAIITRDRGIYKKYFPDLVGYENCLS